MKRNTFLVALLVGVLSVGMVAGSVNALKLGDLIKVGGIVYIVDKFGSQINNFVNKLLAKNDLAVEESTKVVPILSVGEGGYVGACQVTGPKEAVEKCNCVIQYEDDTVLGAKIRVRALVPCETRSIKNVKRLKGIGISTLVDIKI